MSTAAPPPATSSPLSQSFSSQLSASAPSSAPLPQYRDATTISYELREAICTYLEEGLYTQALILLHNLTSARVIRPPIPVPPPSHLAVLFTLTVHPSLTTRARTAEQRTTATLALRYLHLLARTVGPRAAGIPAATAFTSRRRHAPQDGIKGRLAQDDALFVRASDFWAAVGWAFNCSVAHPARWVFWQGWLELMVRLLEDDGVEGLLVQYVGDEVRRVVRAIFADGTAEFGEVWKGETKARKVRGRQEEMERLRKLDIDNDEYADYLVSDASSDAEPSPPPPSTDPTAPLGGPAALALRLRLLALLSRLAADAPGRFVPSTTLFDLLVHHIRSLPLPTFAAVLAALAPFPPDHAVALVQNVAQTLLEPGAHVARGRGNLDQDVLTRAYLPWAAGTASVADNAKAGACIESLLRIFDREIGLERTPELARAADTGVTKRESKGTREAKGREDRPWMRASGERVRAVVAR